METVSLSREDIILIVLVFVLIGLWFLHFLALAAHALGLKPPLWMIDMPIFGVPSRLYAVLFVLFVLVLLFLMAAMIFDIPLVSDLLFSKR